MKLKDLKKSLAKLPPDMDDMEVMTAYAVKGERHYELLCFTGLVPLEGHEFIVLGTISEMHRMVEAGQITKPDGYITPEEYKH